MALTPDEKAAERVGLIALSDQVWALLSDVRKLRGERKIELDAMIANIRELNASPEIQRVDSLRTDVPPDIPGMMERFVEGVDADLAAQEAELEQTWLGLQESLVALEEQ